MSNRTAGSAVDPDVVAPRGASTGDPLIVLGMHRSGTSALTGALSLLGVELGEPLMAPREGENSRGHFEHLEIYRFHQRLLDTLGVSWDDLRSPRFEQADDPLFVEQRAALVGILQRQFADAPLWAVKDPRACRFVPLWNAALAELECTPRYLIICRHPDEVAASLGHRNRFSRDKSDLLWADHYLAAEAATRGARRVVLSYVGLLQAPEEELTRAAGELEVEWPEADTAETSAALREFLSSRLRHHVAPASALVPRGRLGAIVPRLWRILDAASASATLDEVACESLRAELAEVQGSFDPLLVEHFSQLAARSDVGRRVTELEDLLAERTRWLRLQDDELEGQRKMLRSIEDQLEERTRWQRIQDEILHRQIARIDALEGFQRSEDEDEDREHEP